MLIRNSSIYILAKFIPGIIAFSALAIYTHLLTPDEYGIYTLIFTATIFIFTSAFIWLPVGMIRFWPGREYDEVTFISTVGVLYRCLSLPIIIGAATIACLVEQRWMPYLAASLMLLFSYSCLHHGQMLKTAQMRPTNYTIMTVSYSVLALSLGSFLAYIGWGPLGLLFGIATGMLIPSVFFTYQSWGQFDQSKFSPALAKKLILYGTPLAASFLLDEVASISDRYMLAWLSGEAEAGKYAVGYDLAGNSILMIMNAVNLAAYPMIVKLLDTEGKAAAVEYFKTYVILLLGVSIPAVIGLSLIGPNLVELVIGEEYQASVILVLPWVAVAIFFMGCGSFYVHLPFQLGNYNVGIFKIAGAIAVLNLILNYFLIPTMGMQGAAIATLLSFIVSIIIGYIFGRRVFPIPFPVNDILKILSASCLMGVCLYYLKDFRGWLPLLMQLFGGLGIYLFAAYLLDIGGIKKYASNQL